MKYFYIFSGVLVFLLTAVYGFYYLAQSNDEMEAKEFIHRIERKVIPLMKEMSTAYFNAAITGDTNDYKRSAGLEIQLSQIYSDKNDFNVLKKFKNSDQIKDELLKRELSLMYNDFLRKQINPKKSEEIIKQSNIIEQKFVTFRTLLDNKSITDNEVNEILKKNTDSKELENVWLSSKKIGEVVAEDVIKLVILRNKVAKELGFKNFHQMELLLNEQNPNDIEKIFDELDSLTRGTYRSLKRDIDKFLAQRDRVEEKDLMPWHYQDRFFQEAPQIYSINPDVYFKDQDVVKLAKDFYGSIGIDISSILTRSDLYEKKGKNQHAFCTDIDRQGDVRILANVKQNQYWMGTMLHELGHGIYFKKIDGSLPYILREPAHTFTTEAIAMFLQRFSSDPEWYNEMKLISKEEKEKIKSESHKASRLQQLIFSRWAQVMYRFEKGMYENPNQNLNELWWTLVEQFQMIKRPVGRNKPDWASKIHIITNPCYYHNYLLGEILASQLSNHIFNHVVKTHPENNFTYCNHPEIGDYLIERIFKPGRKWYWNDLIKNATGENLTAKYYAAQFVN